MRYAIDDCVDEYEIDAVLGEGGFGETYKSRKASTGETVVHKLPHISIAG